MRPEIQTEPSSKESPYSFEEAPPQVSEWRRFIRVFIKRKVVICGVVIISLLIFTAVFAPVLSPYPPDKQNLANALQGPSGEHWLGTDHLGRDQVSRLIFGTRIALQVGVISVGVATRWGRSQRWRYPASTFAGAWG